MVANRSTCIVVVIGKPCLYCLVVDNKTTDAGVGVVSSSSDYDLQNRL